MFLGQTKALEFLTGYIIEKSLSVDNLFVFIMIFGYFKIRGEHQARILKWGIIGALVLRAIFIFTGIELLDDLPLAVLPVRRTAAVYRLENGLWRRRPRCIRTKTCWSDWPASCFPSQSGCGATGFLNAGKGLLVASPLFLALVMVESSDVLFAIDSIPAIFAVTLDPFIVFTSNIFAIMGLRALYFLLASVMGMFVYLKLGISSILVFVGGKMIAGVSGFPVPITVSLTIIFLALAIAVLASVLCGRNRRQQALENN